MIPNPLILNLVMFYPFQRIVRLDPRTNIPDSLDFLNKSAKTVLGQGHCPISLNDFSSISTITEYVLPFVSLGFSSEEYQSILIALFLLFLDQKF